MCARIRHSPTTGPSRLRSLQVGAPPDVQETGPGFSRTLRGKVGIGSWLNVARPRWAGLRLQAARVFNNDTPTGKLTAVKARRNCEFIIGTAGTRKAFDRLTFDKVRVAGARASGIGKAANPPMVSRRCARRGPSSSCRTTTGGGDEPENGHQQDWKQR
jgi:hypothetical protein